MAVFVLVHGAFHGAWCWVKLIPELEARGHSAIALDLPGQGDDRTPIGAVTLDANAAAIAVVVERQAEPVVLVGHSLAGVSVAAAAERVPDRIALLVFLAAFLPRDGDSVASLSALPSSRKEAGPPAFAKTGDGLGFVALAEFVPERFYSGCSEADIAYALPRFRPQAYAVQRQAVRLTPERYGRVPRVYAECLDDNAISLGLQRDMVARSPCLAVMSLPTGHSPFFSAPGPLADTLVKLAEEHAVPA